MWKQFTMTTSVVLALLAMAAPAAGTPSQEAAEPTTSQETGESATADLAEMSGSELFQRARELAFSGQRQQARDAARLLLERDPDHHDARVLLGRVLAWDRRYDEAREQLHVVLEAKPDYTDARRALVDVETWSENYAEAVGQADAGLRHDAGDEDLLFKKARALRKLDRDAEATETLERLLAVNPEHEEARQAIQDVDGRGEAGYYRVRDDDVGYKIGVDYDYVDFNTFEDPWQQMSLEASARTRAITIVGRMNYANRFAENTVQYEVDAYPKFGGGMYAYLNFGYSPSRFFPEYRYGAELYKSLPGSFEASAGFRHLSFENTDVTIYTGSVGKYWGNYWISVRPYITPKEDTGTSASVQVWLRKYGATRYDYIGFKVGAGSKPDDTLTTIDLERLRSYTFGFDGKKPVGGGVLFTWNLGYSRDELPFDRDRDRFNVSAGFEKLF